MSRVHRRRFIAISASAAGLPLLPFGTAANPALEVWRGDALGADAMLQIHHPDPATARRLIADALDEIARLEAQLSLYRPDSALVRLNRDGRLDDPPFDLLRVLSAAVRFHELTEGAFDATVQPLWDLYTEYFSKSHPDPSGPSDSAIASALTRVGQTRMLLDQKRIDMAPGMSVTLNGIGQGYVTDRVVELLRRSGVEHALVDMGETRAIGGHPAGGAWRVGLEDPVVSGQVDETLLLIDQAVSTSGGYGTQFDPAGLFNHIFNPRDGRTSWRYGAVSVVASDATTADALSTAFCLLPPERIAQTASALGVKVHVAHHDGSRDVIE